MLTVIEGKFPVKPDEGNNAACIKFLEDALAKAKAEGGWSCAVIVLTADGGVLDGWSEVPIGTVRPYMMVGAMEALKLQYAQRHIETR